METKENLLLEKDQEIWKDVLGYEGIYQISSLGRVKSLSRKRNDGGITKDIFLNPYLEKKGYFRYRLLKNKKAQNTAEYAILIALVIGAVVAMQTYAQRALQGRIRDASIYMKDKTSELGSTGQYEPYYSCSTSASKRDTSETFHQHGSNMTMNVMTSNKDEEVLAPSTTGE